MSISSSNLPIGFFDSGVGGLTVLNKVKKLLPNENFIFFGDTEHIPYGEKTKEQLLSYAEPILNFFQTNNCKAVVMACNTTSSVIYEDIKDKYDFVLYPVVQSVAKILANLPITKLGVFATKATIESNAYSKEISKYNPNMKIFAQFCPQWVNIVESNSMNEPENTKIILNDLKIMMQNEPQKIVLGCTHYPYLSKILEQKINKDMLIDPALFLAEFIKKDLEAKNLLSNNVQQFERFYVSSDPKQFKISAKMFYQLDKEPTLLKF